MYTRLRRQGTVIFVTSEHPCAQPAHIVWIPSQEDSFLGSNGDNDHNGDLRGRLTKRLDS